MLVDFASVILVSYLGAFLRGEKEWGFPFWKNCFINISLLSSVKPRVWKRFEQFLPQQNNMMPALSSNIRNDKWLFNIQGLTWLVLHIHKSMWIPCMEALKDQVWSLQSTKKPVLIFLNATAHPVINTVIQHCLGHCVSLDSVLNVTFFLKSHYPLMCEKSGLHSARSKVLWASKHPLKPMSSCSSLQKRHPFIATCTILERKVEPRRSTVTRISPLDFAYTLRLYMKIMHLTAS